MQIHDYVLIGETRNAWHTRAAIDLAKDIATTAEAVVGNLRAISARASGMAASNVATVGS
jgi:hypothetical protein